jgi:hypothetical protein
VLIFTISYKLDALPIVANGKEAFDILATAPSASGDAEIAVRVTCSVAS